MQWRCRCTSWMLLQGWGCKNPLEPREYWERILIEPRECKEGIWPVNGDAEDVKGGDGGHMHVHRVVEVTHQGPKLPRSWWRTLVQLVNIESPKVFILWFILWHFCFLSSPRNIHISYFFNARVCLCCMLPGSTSSGFYISNWFYNKLISLCLRKCEPCQ